MSRESFADPRPTVVEQQGSYVLEGGSCIECGHATVRLTRRCPRCGAPTEPATFGPAGTVWASTTVHVPTPERPDPYTLAYVDLESGPRLLAHVASSVTPLAVGTPIGLVGSTEAGDPCVEVRS